MLRTDHLHRGAVLVELLQRALRQAADLYEGGVDDQRVVRGRDDEPVQCRTAGAVGCRTVLPRAPGPGHPGEGGWCHGRTRRQADGTAVEDGQQLRGGAGLAQVAPVIGQHVLEHPTTDSVGDALEIPAAAGGVVERDGGRGARSIVGDIHGVGGYEVGSRPTSGPAGDVASGRGDRPDVVWRGGAGQ